MTVTFAVASSLVTLRQATPADRDELTRMFGRCTPQTRYRRFHGAVSAFPPRYLAEALSRDPVHHALVACAVGVSDGQPDNTRRAGRGGQLDDTRRAGRGAAGGVRRPIVALASCRVVDEGMAELGVLVEDAWQRRGVGTALLDELVAHARALGLRALTAQLLADEAWTAGLLDRYGSCRAGLASRGTVTVTLRLPPGPEAGPGTAGAPADQSFSCRPAATRSASA